MSDTKTPVGYAELRELLSKAVKRLEHVTGCDMHFFHPDATSCDGKTSMGECRHKRTCELIFESRKALAKPQRNCDDATRDGNERKLRKALNDLCFAVFEFCKLRRASEVEDMAVALNKAKGVLAETFSSDASDSTDDHD